MDQHTAKKARHTPSNQEHPQNTTTTATSLVKPSEPGSITTECADSKTAVLASFGAYRDTLDAHYDQRERIIKCSRDITAMSKKMVFALLRITQDGPAQAFRETEKHHKRVIELFCKVSVDLQGTDALKYQAQVTHGVQEYVEAIGLWVFLRDNKLITKQQVVEYLTVGDTDGGPIINITDSDYVLGICDLPGEVNRYCINSLGKGDREAVKRCVEFLRVLKEGVELLLCTGKIKDLKKKAPVFDSSLAKSEAAYYSLSLREGETGAMDVDTAVLTSGSSIAVSSGVM
ncbi:hypothetical protein H4217_003996 [Coemansia sp. RSA 1939]|nr:hypothetical protein H4217_003996 [Coemansia sp. RSA 1939]KAJ2612526.1 hypothetical protein EV177_002949 [Coemansia sp. RSA 1804]KAJ2690690.1 hypothetical protein GGH99_002574 [Coemansia sp. RSA 1285]